MPKRINNSEKIDVRVGGADVVKRGASSMDMVSKKNELVENSESKPKKPKRSWFKKKDKPKQQKPEPVVERNNSTDEPPKATWCDKGIRIVLPLAIIVIPILFLPFTLEALELNKQVVLYVLAIIGLLLWLIKIVIEKKLTLVKTALTIPVLAFLGVYLISAILSIDRYVSFFGFYGQFNGGFIEVAALVVIFFLAINNIRSLKRVTEYLYSFTFAYLIIVIFSWLQIAGVYLLPWEFTHTVTFSMVGTSLATLSIFVAMGLGVVTTLALRENGWRRACSVIIALAGIGLLFILDSSVGWIALVVTMVVIFALVVGRMGQMGKSRGVNWLPLVFLALAVVFLLIPVSDLVNLNIPPEISLGREVSWDVAKDTIAEKPLLGSGPETFFQDYTAHRPEQINDSIIWDLRFDKAGSQFFQYIATIGVIGTVAWLAIIIVFAWKTLRTITRIKDSDYWLAIVGPFSAWAALTVTSFFYFANTTLMFSSWILMALTLASVIYVSKKAGLQEAEEKTWSFAKSAQLGLITSFIFLLVLIGGIFSFYYIGKMYLADVNYKSSQQKLIAQDLDAATSHIIEAARLNPSRAVYHIGVAQVLMAQANKNAGEESPDVNLIGNLVRMATDAVRVATDVEPSNAANWEGRASVYQNVSSYVPGAEEWMIDSYQKAIERDPMNPILHSLLGKAYVLKSSRILAQAAAQQANPVNVGEVQGSIPPETEELAQATLDMAVDNFLKSIELKQNYFDAHLSLAQTYDKKGDYENAIKEIKISLVLSPKNPNVLYEYGRILYNKEDIDAAEEKLNMALELFPDHANSIYSLGLIHLKRDEKDLALEKFKKVLELNPENEEVKQKIEEIENPGAAADPEENIEAEIEEEVDLNEPVDVDLDDKKPLTGSGSE